MVPHASYILGMHILVLFSCTMSCTVFILDVVLYLQVCWGSARGSDPHGRTTVLLCCPPHLVIGHVSSTYSNTLSQGHSPIPSLHRGV
jgi:hypothetical protein